jgi:hypothetical protein
VTTMTPNRLIQLLDRKTTGESHARKVLFISTGSPLRSDPAWTFRTAGPGNRSIQQTERMQYKQAESPQNVTNITTRLARICAGFNAGHRCDRHHISNETNILG